MNVKDYVLGLLQPEDVWPDMFEGWKPGRNVPCVVAAEQHESGQDANPSMSLSEDGKAYCHSCGYKATSPIGVLADMEGLEFKDACKAAYERFVGPLVPEEYVRECHQELLGNEYMQAVLEERRGIGLATIKRFELGWDEKRKRTVIPVRNDAGWCVNTRLHDTLGVHPPKMKILSYAKGFGSAHLWPHWQLEQGGPVFLFEGEMDALLAHSQGLPSLSVTGGADTWREEWSRRLKGRVVNVVPDNDKAGMKGAAKKAESLAKRCQVRVVELPGLAGGKDQKDFTDWVMKAGHTGKELAELAQAATEQAPTREESEQSADEELSVFDELSSQESIDIKRGQAAWRWLKARGAFFRNQDQKLFYAKESGSAYNASDKSEVFLAMLGNSISWAINSATRSGKFIIKHILSRGMSEAKDSVTGSFSLYQDGDIYLHCGNDQLVRARAGKLEIIKNALNERGVLLESPAQVKSMEPVLDADPGEAARLMWERCFNLMPISQTDRYLAACWWAGLLIKEYVRPKPLLRFMAKTAYGKSTATKMMSLLTYGDEVLQNSATTPAALYAIAKQFPVIFSDNVETRNMTPAFEDFMLTAATGGGKSKRQMHTDSGVIWEGSNCLVCTNGIEPVNKREIVSRTVELNLDLQKYGQKNFHETKVFEGIKECRPRIIFGLLRLFTGQVEPRIKQKEVERIARELGSHAKNRFDLYIGVMALILDALWPYIGDPEIEGGAKAVVAAWLKGQDAASEEQDEGTNEVLYFLQELADRGKGIADVRTRPETGKDGVLKIQGTTREIFTDFRVMARALNAKCPWQNERQLGTRIGDAFGVLVKAGWHHRTKLLAGRRINEFTKRANQAAEAAPLRAVAAGGVPGQGVQDEGGKELDVHPGKGATKGHAVRGVRKAHKHGGARKAGRRVEA